MKKDFAKKDFNKKDVFKKDAGKKDYSNKAGKPKTYSRDGKKSYKKNKSAKSSFLFRLMVPKVGFEPTKPRF